ncbi:MAG: hypothetical protein GXZ12_04515 [Clostridiaceae bacterium]|jgi:hypothetical protein|nr:hypothetical protein [Clostridiaceae bacterium]
MFEFKINLSYDDYILFNNYSFLNSPSGKRLLMINKMMIPIFCFLCVVVLIAFNLDVLLILIEAIVLTILSILWIFFDKKIFLRILDKNLRKTEKEGRLSFEGEAVLKFDDESIHVISPNSESKTKYSLVEKVAVSEKAIYLY